MLSIVLLIPIASAPCRAEAADEQQESTLTPEQERLQKQKRVLEAMQAERRNREEAKAKSDKERQESSANCEKSRQELSNRQNARYLYRKTENGERDVLSEEDREKATAEAQAAVKKWCNQ